LDPAEARNRLHDAPVARLATVRPDGGPHIVPICFVLLEGDVVYSAVDEKPKSTTALQRLANVRADPRAAVLADHYAEDWSTLWWVRGDGHARLADGAEREGAVAALRHKYPQYEDHRLGGDVLAVEVSSWSGWGSQIGH
jgi:PPOX class probable F420-dependent enzyme